MPKLRFEIKSRDKKTRARTGIINTTHGIIRTPAFVPVGSGATVKALTPQELKTCGIDVFFVNTYHMFFRPGIETVKKCGGLHKFSNWNGPIMTDSGGFQAFSLGEGGPRQNNPQNEKSLVKINEEGIFFKSVWDGRKVFLGPKASVSCQQDLDSDIMMAFDECTFYPIKKKRAQEAMERTHRWAKVCLETAQSKQNFHALYGIVQGSVFQDLRKASAKFMTGRSFDGFAIGSVANSREPREIVFAVLDWTMPILIPQEKPIHFLGVGEIEDIFLSVERGIDSLDCITPTRLGRMGWIFTKKADLKNKFRYDITKAAYSVDKNPPDKDCRCFTCQNFSRAYLNHLFRCRELLAYRLATIHNLSFFGSLMFQIREAIEEKNFLKLKKDWLGK